MTSLLWAITLLFQDLPDLGRIRDVASGANTLALALPLSTAERALTCSVEFPEETLSSLVVSWDESALSIDRQGPRLFLKLLKPAEGDVQVIGSSGTLYRLFVRHAPPGEPYDARIRIVAPTPSTPRRSDAVELIRAMRRGRVPPGVRVRLSTERLKCTSRQEIRLARVYDSPRYCGYVLRLKNLTSGTQRVDPSRFSAASLVLIGAREIILKPQAETTLYLVFSK